jgi:hypothetical protein
MKRRTLLAAALTTPALGRLARAAAVPVDLLLVLAVDVSRSIVESDARLQRDGYRNAFLDPEVQAAIRGGPVGAIGVAYVEWAAFDRQQLLIPWTRIGSRDDARAWGDALAAQPWSSITWTSLSGALRFSADVLAGSPFEGTRRVVDVSGDGVNNNGPPAERYRDALVGSGVVINGLPIVNDRPRWGPPNGAELVPYYRESVAGGEGHFVIVAEGFDTFAAAIKRKLIQEIA